MTLRIREVTPEEDNEVCPYCEKIRREHRYNQWYQHKISASKGRTIIANRSPLLSDKEMEYLYEQSDEKTLGEIAEEWNVTYGWLRNRTPPGLYKRGCKKGSKTITFSSEEDKTIIKWWGKKPIKDIFLLLNRDDCHLTTFRGHATKDLGLSNYVVRFSVEEDRFLTNWWGRIKMGEIAEALERPIGSVRSRAVRDLGFPSMTELKDPETLLKWLSRNRTEDK